MDQPKIDSATASVNQIDSSNSMAGNSRRRSNGVQFESPEPGAIKNAILPADGSVESRSVVPSADEIKAELWRIGTGDGTESSRVSALRALADIMGISKASPPEFPPGMQVLLDALGEGLSTDE